MTFVDELDKVDIKILSELGGDGRLSWRELAEKIGLSLTPTLRRVHRLEKAGFIKGYSAQLDESRLAGNVSVIVSVSLEKQSQDALDGFEREILASPQVMNCFMMTGDADFILRVVVGDLNDYQRFLTTTLTKIKGVAHVKSSVVLKTVLYRQAPLLLPAPKKHVR